MNTAGIDIALFDMDGSLADYEGALVRDLEALRGPGEPPLTAENVWDLADFDHVRARMRLVKAQPGWWLNLAPIPAGMQVLRLCEQLGFDVHILTKGPKRHSLAWDEKVRWCQQHVGPEVDIHVTSDKGLVYGKLLYDDYPEYMLRWLAHRPRGLGIMPVTPHNRAFTHPNVVRWDGTNLADVTRAIVAARTRAPGTPLVLR
jgi:5'-nucleotidase